MDSNQPKRPDPGFEGQPSSKRPRKDGPSHKPAPSLESIEEKIEKQMQNPFWASRAGHGNSMLATLARAKNAVREARQEGLNLDRVQSGRITKSRPLGVDDSKMRARVAKMVGADVRAVRAAEAKEMAEEEEVEAEALRKVAEEEKARADAAAAEKAAEDARVMALEAQRAAEAEQVRILEAKKAAEFAEANARAAAAAEAALREQQEKAAEEERARVLQAQKVAEKAEADAKAAQLALKEQQEKAAAEERARAIEAQKAADKIEAEAAAAQAMLRAEKEKAAAAEADKQKATPSWNPINSFWSSSKAEPTPATHADSFQDAKKAYEDWLADQEARTRQKTEAFRAAAEQARIRAEKQKAAREARKAEQERQRAERAATREMVDSIGAQVRIERLAAENEVAERRAREEQARQEQPSIPMPPLLVFPSYAEAQAALERKRREAAARAERIKQKEQQRIAEAEARARAAAQAEKLRKAQQAEAQRKYAEDINTWLKACDVFMDPAKLTTFPSPPPAICKNLACHATVESRALTACQCSIKRCLSGLDRQGLKTARLTFHPDKFSCCPENVRESYKAMANEIFVVADRMYKEKA